MKRLVGSAPALLTDRETTSDRAANILCIRACKRGARVSCRSSWNVETLAKNQTSDPPVLIHVAILRDNTGD